MQRRTNDKHLAEIFPNASESCRLLNSAILTPDRKAKNAVQGMNKTEAQFGQRLQLQKKLGEIRDYLFHPFSLPWGLDPESGKPMRYTPDFMVTPIYDRMEKRRIIEVKGPHIHYRQQALARFKGCRAYWPEFSFELWQKQKSGWKRIH